MSITPKQAALNAAIQSKCEKRKVGAAIANSDGTILATACNYSESGCACEDAAGATKADVIHAEVAAIDKMKLTGNDARYNMEELTIYTTHAPCADCRAAIERVGIEHIVVVETFMKFDTDKLRYDLIPVDWSEGDAEIITFGAAKYKPNNWKEVDDVGRYFAALERHLIACKKAYEKKDTTLLFDEETKLHHMKHLRTNAGFLLTLLEDKINEYNNRSDS